MTQDKDKPLRAYEDRYGSLLQSLSTAIAGLVVANDVVGIHFLIECCDAILGRALLLIESRHNEGMLN